MDNVLRGDDDDDDDDNKIMKSMLMENADSENGAKEEIDGMMDMKNTNNNIINQCSNQEMCDRMWINHHWWLVHRQSQFGSVNSVIW